MKEKFKQILKMILVIFIIGAMVIFMLVPAFAAETGEKKTEKKTEKKEPVPELYSQSAELYCENQGAVIVEKKKNKKYGPGDMSGLVTVFLAVKELKPEKVVKVSKEAASCDGKVAGLREGQEVTVTDLISGVLTVGASDCTMALAESISDSGEEYINLLNETAKNDLKCRSTVFEGKEGYGIDLAESSTTVSDMVRTVSKIMSDSNLYTIATRGSCTIHDAETKEDIKVERDGFFGSGKDGVLFSANGSCGENMKMGIVYYEKDGLKLITALAGAEDEKMTSDAASLRDYAERTVKGHKVVGKGEEVGKIRVKHGAITRIGIYAGERGKVYLPKEASDNLIRTEIKNDDITAPVKKGEKVGVMDIYFDDELVNEIPLCASRSVDTGWLPSYMGISNRATTIIVIIIIIFVSILVTRGINRAKRKKRRKKAKMNMIIKIAKEEMREERERRERGFPR